LRFELEWILEIIRERTMDAISICKLLIKIASLKMLLHKKLLE